MNSESVRKPKVKYSKVPQFQEGGDGSEIFEDESPHDDAIARPRTGKERTPTLGNSDEEIETRRTDAQIWEDRRRKCEKIMGYIGTKVVYSY